MEDAVSLMVIENMRQKMSYASPKTTHILQDNFGIELTSIAWSVFPLEMSQFGVSGSANMAIDTMTGMEPQTAQTTRQ